MRVVATLNDQINYLLFLLLLLKSLFSFQSARNIDRKKGGKKQLSATK